MMTSKLISNALIVLTGTITLVALNLTLISCHPRLLSERTEHEAIGGLVIGYDCLAAGNCPACTMYAAGGCRGVLIPGGGGNVICVPPVIKPAGTGVVGCATQGARKRCKGVCYIKLCVNSKFPCGGVDFPTCSNPTGKTCVSGPCGIIPLSKCLGC